MKTLFSRWLPAVTLAAWSAILLHFFLSGRIQAFLHPTFRPFVLIAGIVLALLALVFLIFPADADCCGAAECGHGLSRLRFGKILTFLVLLLPLSAAALFSPDGFGKTAVLNRGIVTDASAIRSPAAKYSAPAAPLDLPLPSNDPVPPAPPAASAVAAASVTSPTPAVAPTNDYLQRTPDGTIVAEVLDLLYAAQDTALRADFEGRKVQLLGQLMPDHSGHGEGQRFKVVRMFMTCCAADARPVATLVETARKVDLPEMSWIKIIGTSTFPVESGRRTAVIKAQSVERCDPPSETMLY